LDANAPGIFTRTQDGRGLVAALHQDGISAVTPDSPARPGEVISLFATVLGPVEPFVPTGRAAGVSATILTPSIRIDGITAQVQYSGTAPGYVGLNQVNVRIPEGVRPGTTVPLELSIGGRQSNLVELPIEPR
jgi:uncharacterized protein (TIGR03437 family)